MRIPYPESLPIKHVALFALFLAIVQKLEGTPLYFCAGSAAFILISAFAFNAAGGLTRASGVYVFFYSTLVVIVGISYKAFLGEAAQTNLQDPVTDIEAYVGSIIAMYGAVVISRRFTRRKGLLQDVLKESAMHRAAIGCILFGSLGGIAIAMLGESAAKLETAFAQLNLLIPVGIIIAVMYEIRRSGGTRFTNITVAFGTAYMFYLGATGFSKQGMIEPLFCWLLPVAVMRYRLSVMQVAACFAAAFIIFYWLVPFSQYGRGQVDPDFTQSQRIQVVVQLLEHPNETRSLFYKQADLENAEGFKGLSSYYNNPQGFWERLQFVSVDDALNNFTDHGHIFGLLPVEMSVANIVPHFIWPDKPSINLGNMYAHELTGTPMGEGDVDTGIAFSPTSEAYHLGGWAGIFILAPLMWCMLFIIYDSLLGDIRASPWGLLALASISHAAPESGINGTIYLCSIGAESLVFCAFFAAWFAPLLATVTLGPESTKFELHSPLPRALASRNPR